MCSFKTRVHQAPAIARSDGRPVLQQNLCNQIPSPERRNSLAKKSLPPRSPPQLPNSTADSPHDPSALRLAPADHAKPALTPPISPKKKMPRISTLKRGNDPTTASFATSSPDKVFAAQFTTRSTKKSVGQALPPSPDTLLPGSIAAARKEQIASLQEQRKLKIAHYGRVKPFKRGGKVVPLNPSSALAVANREEKRCSFITASSDPIYVAYHDQEWGVPVHDDRNLFELLVLSGAQVGSDWTSVLKKRQVLREAFSGYDAEIVAQYSEKKITSLSSLHGLELSQIRGAVDNSKRILEVRTEYGSFNKYLWGFVNHKPIITEYRTCQRIPVKTSKSEMMSKDMVRRGFRYVGPTIMHSFMQAAGLVNDHLISCPRRLLLQCH
ncbi:uncharacterized protein LOC115754981 [Rhodamnia argentea]|uniref:Uncharacterized protein LOC115754981 n=1 Tax=Rhodamnia argentea TaxID=178133 RepID=A0A8B8QS66_9MYRT|nr:uncharacterized protein LOC115754981 [Rhodamnia argentea]